MSRRQDYAKATRQAIQTAARTLFAQRGGYFATRVEDIASQARVAPATVYALTRGQSGAALVTEGNLFFLL
jgi:AcrR family transcriptional regulator